MSVKDSEAYLKRERLAGRQVQPLKGDSRTVLEQVRDMLDCELQAMIYDARSYDEDQRKTARKVLNERGSRKANGAKW